MREYRWWWSLEGMNVFMFKQTRKFIDNVSLLEVALPTRWNQFVTRKENIFVWHASLDRLPSRWNLAQKGVEVSSLLCPICSNSVETVDHIFLAWKIA